MNRALKHALVDYQEPAYRVAQLIGVPHTAISKFIAEIQKPTDPNHRQESVNQDEKVRKLNFGVSSDERQLELPFGDN